MLKRLLSRLLFGPAVLVALSGTALGSPAKRPPAPRNGTWSKATTVATFRGKWSDAKRHARLRGAKHGDDVLPHFPTMTAQALVAVALETGMGPYLKAIARPGEAVPIPEKNLEVTYHVRRERAGGGVVFYQPVFTLRVTRLTPAGAPPGLPPFPPPGAPPGLPFGLP